MATHAELAQVITAAAAVYTNFKMQIGADAFVAAWHRHVGHLPADRLQASFDRAVHESTFFPTVHDVLRAAAQLEAGEQRTGLEAWGDFIKAVELHGYMHPPSPDTWQFDDPLVGQALDCLGKWYTVCIEMEPDMVRGHFIRAYEAMAIRKVQKSYPAIDKPDNRPILISS